MTPRKQANIDAAKKAAAGHALRLGIDLEACAAKTIIGNLRKANNSGKGDSVRLTRDREVLWAALREDGYSFPVIAEATGGNCHASVMAAIARLRRRGNP